MFKSSKKAPSKKRNTIVSLALAGAIAITGAFAYLTATDTAENLFTVGNVKAELTEPNWLPNVDSDNDGIADTLSNIIAGQDINKDPTITNIGTNNAYVYIMVEIPKAYEIDVKNENDTITENHHPLFGFETNTGWTLVNSQTGTETDAYDYYLYAYDTFLSPNESATLFNSVTFASIANPDSEYLKNLDIKITGYAIQSDFYNNEASNAAEAWTLYANQNNWSWPNNIYENLVTISYVNEDNEVIYTDTTLKNTPTELYFNTSLAKAGYSFDWKDKATSEYGYNNMKFTEDTTLTASYTSTGYGTKSDNYLIYLLKEDENGEPYASIVGVDISNSSYPTDENPASVLVIPNTITFTKPASANSANLNGKMEENGLVMFPTSINTPINTKVQIPVKEIETQAFENYYVLNSSANYDPNNPYIAFEAIVIPDTVQTLGEGLFAENYYVEKAFLPYGIKEIPNSTFANAYFLEDVNIPNTVTTLDDYSFNNCISISEISLPKGVEKIGEYSFEACESLKTITIPNLVTTIETSTFDGCTELSTINIPDSVSSIKDRAFSYCDNLTDVSIGENITYIANNAFYNCLSLEEINVSENNSNYTSENGVLYSKKKTSLICFPTASTITNFITPKTVQNISEKAFWGATNLKSVFINNNVETIGAGAFANCNNLETVTFENNSKIVKIDDSLFEYCSSLNIIEIPNKAMSIGTSAFYGCTSLHAITIPNSINLIQYGAFAKCSALKTINFEGTQTEWNDITIKDHNENFLNANILYY